MQGIAQALQSTGEQLREQDQDSIGQYADQAGRLADYLDDKDSEELMSEVEDFARNKPAIFMGGARSSWAQRRLAF